jgi:hypothetical protein
MRTFPGVDKGAWIAGITRKGVGSRMGNYLFFLGRVKTTFLTHEELWNALSTQQRKSKDASIHTDGDVYHPKRGYTEFFHPTSYYPPSKGHLHLHHDGWHDDIKPSYPRPSKLLMLDPHQSFVWTLPKIQLKVHDFGRGQRKVTGATNFINLFEDT